MAAVYKSICYEADSLLLEITRLAEEEISLKVMMEKLMNDSFVDLAKARYIMGSNCVTKMQLPTENSNPIKPLVTVVTEKINDHLVFKTNRNDVFNTCTTHTSFAIQNGDDSDSDSEVVGEVDELVESQKAFKMALKEYPSSLKKSKHAYCVADKSYSEYNDKLLDEMSTDSESSLVSVSDPIRLFGVLVPNALKQAQVGFKRIVDMLGQCSTVQQHLKDVLYKYTHLMRVKSLIEAAARETKVNIIVPRVYWTPSEESSFASISSMSSRDSQQEETEGSKVSVQKSIRSVLFDTKGEAEMDTALWSYGSDSTSEI